jgi:hypothetical protein
MISGPRVGQSLNKSPDPSLQARERRRPGSIRGRAGSTFVKIVESAGIEPARRPWLARQLSDGRAPTHRAAAEPDLDDPQRPKPRPPLRGPGWFDLRANGRGDRFALAFLSGFRVLCGLFAVPILRVCHRAGRAGLHHLRPMGLGSGAEQPQATRSAASRNFLTIGRSLVRVQRPAAPSPRRRLRSCLITSVGCAGGGADVASDQGGPSRWRRDCV